LLLFGALVATISTPVHAVDLPRQLQPSDFLAVDRAWADIGQLLFYDPILSGNRNISCGTCHSHEFGSADGLSLGIGEGGSGVGPDRTFGIGADRIKKRIPRNAPALWNLGAKEVNVMFHDGRVSRSNIYGNGFDTPAQEWLPSGLNGILAVQAIFPMASQFEMAGDPKENQVAGAAYDRIDAVWPILAKRVRIIPEYADMFVAAFEIVREPGDINITQIANALAAFEAMEWQSYDSPFDAYLGGDLSALTDAQQSGTALFYGKANCASCHSGPLLTDQAFHALALPHFGPGRTRRWDPIVRDVGRMAASDRLTDAYRFRTPSLRNVALTAPYGHNGAYPDLLGIVKHHLQPSISLAEYDPALARLPKVPWLMAADFRPLDDHRERARLGAAVDIAPKSLTAVEVDQLVAFLHSLTGTHSIDGRLGRPARVPSGLGVD
jgi:cytochrome c peroxidase